MSESATRCWRCGRSTNQWWGDEYLFGPICDRADCRRIKEGLSNRWRQWNCHTSLGFNGKPSCWSADGEVNYARV